MIMDSAYDNALLEIGTGGIFQKKFDIIYNVVFSALWSMAYVHMILALVVVPHNCKLPEKTENVTDDIWKLKYIPHENVYGDKIKFDGCHIYLNPDENNITSACDQYEYDHTWYGSTVSTEKDWVCDKEIYIPNILAYSKVTELIGCFFFGWIGDAYGRRPTHIVTMGLIVIGRVVSLLAEQSYTTFLFGCLITSFSVWSAMQTASVISVEITSPKRRSIITSLRFGASCVGMSIMALTYWWLRDWQMFVIVTTVPMVFYLLISWTIIESPRWQYSNGKTKQCIKQLQKIAKSNRRSLKPETEKEILSFVPQNNMKSLGPLAFFSARTLAINTLLQLVSWTVGNMAFTLQVLYIGQNPEGNPFIELCVQSLSEIPANLISAWLADTFGRRYTGAVSFFVISASWTLLALRETSSYAWTRAIWIGTLLNIFIRLANAIAYYAVNLFAMELYPTCLRQSGLSLGNVCSSVGAVITPYILFLGRPIDERLPGLVVAAFSLCSVFCTLALPETLNKKLPETIEEAQNFGKKPKKYSSVPLNPITQEKNIQHIASDSVA